MSEAEEETRDVSESSTNEGERKRESGRHRERKSSPSRTPRDSKRSQRSHSRATNADERVPVSPKSPCKETPHRAEESRIDLSGSTEIVTSASTRKRASGDSKKYSRGTRATTPGAKAVTSSSSSSRASRDKKKASRGTRATTPGAEAVASSALIPRGKSRRNSPHRPSGDTSRNDRNSSQSKSQNRDLKENDKRHRIAASGALSLPGAHRASANDDDNDDERSSNKGKEQEHKKSIRNGALGPSALIAHSGEDVRAQRKQERNEQRQSYVSSSSSSHRTNTHVEGEEEIQVVASPVEEHDDGAKSHPETVPEFNENRLEFVGETAIEAGRHSIKDPTDSRERGFRWIVVSIVILVLIGGGVGAYFGLRSSGTDNAQSQELSGPTTSPMEPIAIKASEAPSNTPTDQEIFYKYPVPSIGDCETIAAGGTLDGQDELEERNFEVTMDVGFSLDDINLDAKLPILEDQIKRILLPRLAGCPITLDGIQTRRLQDASARNVIANGLVEVKLKESDECLIGYTESCHVVAVLLNLRLLGFERYLTIWKIINDVFVDGNELKDTLRLGEPFFAIAVRAIESVDITPTPTVAPSTLPSIVPAVFASQTPSLRPSRNPVSSSPTVTESSKPSPIPSIRTSNLPSTGPSSFPSSIPSVAPTSATSSGPSNLRSALPSEQPSSAPSTTPSTTPTASSCISSNEALTTAVSQWFDSGLKASVEAEYGLIGDWCFTKDVTSMSGLFANRTDFNEDISAWDVSGITNMHQMFFGASAFNQNIGGWNVSQVTSMQAMFRSATVFNQPIGDWDVSKVTNMSDLFRLARAFNQPIGDWDVSSVTEMESVLMHATDFNQPIGNWDTSQVTTMHAAFRAARAFNQPIADWDTSKVTLMSAMFDRSSKFNQPIGDWDVSSVKKTYWMFREATAFNQPIGDWNVTSAWHFYEMFLEASAFNQDISNWDVSSVTNMKNMFGFASAFDQDLCAWGSRLPSSSSTVNAFNEATSCPTTADPDLSATTPGPFCYVC